VRLVLFQIFFKEDEEVSVGLGFSERGELVSDGKDVLPMLKKRLFGCDFDDGFEFALCRQERVSAKRRRRRGEVVVSNRGKSYPRGGIDWVTEGLVKRVREAIRLCTARIPPGKWRID